MTKRRCNKSHLLAISVAVCLLASGARAQTTDTDPAPDPGGQPSSGTQSTARQESGPPTPVQTNQLPYPKLTGIWAGESLEPSLSEKFNQMLPYWLRFSGEIRERFEGYSGGGYKPNSTNDYDLHRLRLGMQIKPVSWFRFFIEAQDARVFGITPALPPYQNAFDIRQAYVQLGDLEGNHFMLQGGRLELTYGNNRLLGNSWWTNVSRSFDGFRAAFQEGRFRLDAIAASVVIVRDGVIDHHNWGNNLYGLYSTMHDVIPRADLDVYQFWHVQRGYSMLNVKGGQHLDQWTTGFRWVGALPMNFDYRTEMAIQLGQAGPAHIHSWMGHWVGGYTIPQIRTSPRLFVMYDFGSGTQNVKSGTYSTFDPIYPSTHDKLGLADQFGWRNIKDLCFGQEFKVARKVVLATGIHDFWLANAHDGLYPSRGSIVAVSPTGAAGTHVAEEFDIQAIYTPTRQTQIGAGYGRVFTAEFLNKTTPGKDYSYPYMLIEYVF